MADGYRCTTCAISWPYDSTYATCPICEGKTDGMTNLAPLSAADAKSAKAHADFERYYARRITRSAA